MKPDAKSTRKRKQSFATKKCPDCYVHLPLSATQCHACNAKVGNVDRLGFAEKPVDWVGYLVAGIAIVVFAVFFWWAFFVE